MAKKSLIIGLTGGIGSGKTTVAKFFEEWGIPLYYADDRAKWIMNHDSELRQGIIREFGEEAYNNEGLDRKYLSSQTFGDEEKLEKLNQLVHPAVARDFENWIEEHENEPLLMKEAAILFESGAYKACDYVIAVLADEEIRIDRVKIRDGWDEEKIKDRLKHQWTDDERMKHANFIINNESDLKNLEEETKNVHKELILLSLQS